MTKRLPLKVFRLSSPPVLSDLNAGIFLPIVMVMVLNTIEKAVETGVEHTILNGLKIDIQLKSKKAVQRRPSATKILNVRHAADVVMVSTPMRALVN